MKKLRHALAGVVVFVLTNLPALAAESQPLVVAPFTLSDTQLTCPNCLADWRAILKNALKPMRSEGMKVIGAVALVDISDPRVVVTTSKHGGTKECADRTGVAPGYEALGQIPLPIRLRTAEEWAKKVRVDLAINANPFKTAPADAAANFSCGEVTGPFVTAGVVEWPPIERKDMLTENVDSDPARPTWAMTFSKQNTVFIRQIRSYTQLQEYNHVIAGVPLFIGYASFPSDTMAAKKVMSRIGIGFLPGRREVLIIQLAGKIKSDGALAPGFPRQGLSILFRSFGALAALELPGGEYAQMASKDGPISALKNASAPQPVAVHLGFRLRAAPLPSNP